MTDTTDTTITVDGQIDTTPSVADVEAAAADVVGYDHVGITTAALTVPYNGSLVSYMPGQVFVADAGLYGLLATNPNIAWMS